MSQSDVKRGSTQLMLYNSVRLNVRLWPLIGLSLGRYSVSMCVVLGRPRYAAALALVAGVLSAAAGAAPAAGWLTPTSTPWGAVSVDAQDLALDAQGNAVAVWTAYGTWRVTQAATRPVGGSWSVPVTFVVPGEEDGWEPRVAVGANGDAVAVWSSVRQPSPGQYQTITMAATRTAGGSWSEPVALSDEDGLALSSQSRIVVDAQGNATALWVEDIAGVAVLRSSTHPKNGDWSEPVSLTDSHAVRDAELSVDAQGEVTAVWTWHVPEENGGGVIQASTRSLAGTWSEAVDLSDSDGLAGFPQLAVDPQGDAVAVWESYRIAYDQARIQAARRTAGAGWSPAVDLSDPDGANPDVAIDPQGTATAVWESNDGVGRLVHASTSALGGPWSAPVDLSARDDAYWWGAFPQVTADPQGDVTAIWRNFYEPNRNRVTTARREPGGAWSAPVELGEANGVIEPLRVAADPQGYVTAAWTLGHVLTSSVYDPVAPALNDVTVPARGVVGQAIALSVDPFDVWPPVVSRWDFGDGSSGAGATVQHCYSTAGERTVRITGTDRASNTTSVTRTIEIEPNPTLPLGADPCTDPGPAPGPGPGPSPGPAPDPAPGPGPGPSPGAPVVSGLHQTTARWRTHAVDRRPRLPVGTRFLFTLDRAATVRLAFAQVIPGRRVRAHCVEPTEANRDKPRCSRYRSRGALTVTGTAGRNAYAFRGRIGARTLPPGRYRLRVTASRDGKRSAAVTIGFTIIR